MTLDPQHSSPSRPRRRLDLIEDQDDVQAIPGYPDVPPALQMGKGLAFDDVFFFFFSLLRLEELRLFRSLFRSLFLSKEVLRFVELILPFRDSLSRNVPTTSALDSRHILVEQQLTPDTPSCIPGLQARIANSVENANHFLFGFQTRQTPAL